MAIILVLLQTGHPNPASWSSGSQQPCVAEVCHFMFLGFSSRSILLPVYLEISLPDLTSSKDGHETLKQ